MKKSCKLCWLANLVLLAVLAYGAYIFGVRGNVEPGKDGRTAVLMSPADRTRVLGEMRGFLTTVQEITAAAAQGDMKTVATVARADGSVKIGQESPAFIGSLPLNFKTLGMNTHNGFDALADLAATNPTPKVVFVELGDLMLNCVACHQSYQIKASN